MQKVLLLLLYSTENAFSGYLKDGIICLYKASEYCIMLLFVWLFVSAMHLFLLFPAEGSEQWRTQWDGVGQALHLCGKLIDLWPAQPVWFVCFPHGAHCL